MTSKKSSHSASFITLEKDENSIVIKEYETEDPIECLETISASLEEHYKAYRNPELFPQREVIANMITEYENELKEILSKIDFKQIHKEQTEKIREILLKLTESAPQEFREELHKIACNILCKPIGLDNKS
jgi:GTP-dependent phosphoenolpyruvate carboxykinase